jgi:Ca2+-dependent lipid-binding protein
LISIPDGLTKLKLKRFDYGNEPPVIKAVRCISLHENVCLEDLTSSTNESNFSCKRAIFDIDFVYVSRDMDIVFTMRSDVKSLLPEASIVLSDGHASNRCRANP